VSVLARKLRRDLWRLKGQVGTIALVLACGILAMVMLRSTYESLLGARAAYYDAYRFADVFARVERAPLATVGRLEALPGVAVVAPRIVKDIMVPLADELDPVTGRIVSLPDHGPPVLNDLYLRAGRLPRPGADDELAHLVAGLAAVSRASACASSDACQRAAGSPASSVGTCPASRAGIQSGRVVAYAHARFASCAASCTRRGPARSPASGAASRYARTAGSPRTTSASASTEASTAPSCAWSSAMRAASSCSLSRASAPILSFSACQRVVSSAD
jgi:hypothetical protein